MIPKKITTTLFSFFIILLFFFFSRLPNHMASNEVMLFLHSVKVVTTYTFMFFIPFRDKTFITHLQKCTQTICLVFMGDIERFENMLWFLSHLHRGMDLRELFFKSLFYFALFLSVSGQQSLFSHSRHGATEKKEMFFAYLHIYFSPCIPWENPTGLQSLNFQNILLLLSVHVST